MNREEWIDLRAAFCQPHVLETYRVSVYSPHALYGESHFTRSDPPPPGVSVLVGPNPWGRNFYHLGRPAKVLLTLLNAACLAWHVRARRVACVVSGSPTLYIRLARWLAGNGVRHLAVLRSAYPGIDRVWSESERWQQRLGRFGLGLPRALRPYSADEYLVAGAATVPMLVARGIERERIQIGGPAALSQIRRERARSTQPHRAPRLFFVTQAFKRHGDEHAQQGQLAVFRSLLSSVDNDPRFDSLVLRPHPRDDVHPYIAIASELNKQLALDDRPASELLREEDLTSVLCGATSTLLFEWAYVGGTAYVIASPAMRQTYQTFYDTIGVKPFSDSGELLDAIIAREGAIPPAATSAVLAVPDRCDVDVLSADLLDYLADGGGRRRSLSTTS